jgi:hypothetical protein
MNTDAILGGLDWTPIFPCDAENCDKPATLVIRYACECPAVIACEQCRNADMADIHLMEARSILNGHDAMQWTCPVCWNVCVAQYPDAYKQVVVSVVTL